IHEDEKLRVAYHESGHALVAYSLPNTDPVHKVSIIPRGLAALGYTMQRPEGDRYLLTQGELESRIQVLLAGTCSEEMVFEDVSTGAQNDLERASAIARSMVMDYGMSRLGRVNFRESNRSPCLPMNGDGQREHSHSEQTAREIDQEVKRIIDEAFAESKDIVDKNWVQITAVAEALLKYETLQGEEVHRLARAIEPHAREMAARIDWRETDALATAIAEGAHEAPAHGPVTAAIRCGTRLAIWLSERV
ncbi:MAG: demethoxyubiquinone hydroxylase family protein, partial [Proteobacteria bacterium]|nr:demethoxyubiquinone hydroxylase family protein [Pseudomonadota bacterium]